MWQQLLFRYLRKVHSAGGFRLDFPGELEPTMAGVAVPAAATSLPFAPFYMFRHLAAASRDSKFVAFVLHTAWVELPVRIEERPMVQVLRVYDSDSSTDWSSSDSANPYGIR